MTSLYGLLGLTKEATKAEIRKAYLKRALQTHPDRKTDCSPEEVELFKEMKHAYEILYDDDKRQQYDSSQSAHHFSPTRPAYPSRHGPSSRSAQGPTYFRPSDHRESTYGPSPRHSYPQPSEPLPRTPTGSSSSDEDDSDEDAASTAYTSLSEPEDEGDIYPHHRRSRAHDSHPQRGNLWEEPRGPDAEIDEGLVEELERKMEADWSAEDEMTSRRRAEMRDDLRKGRATDTHPIWTSSPRQSRPASPSHAHTRERSRSRPASDTRSESHPTSFVDDARSRRTQSYPQPEDVEEEYWRRERWAPTERSRTRPSSPHRERAWRGEPVRFAPGPERRTSYDSLPTQPIPRSRPTSSHRTRAQPPPLVSYSILHSGPSSPYHAPPLTQTSRGSPRLPSAWTAHDYERGGPHATGAPPSSYFPPSPRHPSLQRSSTASPAFTPQMATPSPLMRSPRMTQSMLMPGMSGGLPGRGVPAGGGPGRRR